jgi:hypothetical protein
MNRKQVIVIFTFLFAAVILLLYAPEKTFDVNKNRDVFYTYSWMPKYFTSDLKQAVSIWKDRVYMPFLKGELLGLLATCVGLGYLLRDR